MKIRELIDTLNKATKAYDEGYPIISDKEWDNLYFSLIEEEKKTGIIYSDSPTQKVDYRVVNKLNKVEHNHLMLSLDKTKDINDIKSFIGNHKAILMAKADGLTCSIWYKHGVLFRAETRGNGIVGEDITHNAAVIKTIPKSINTSVSDFIVDGELVCLEQDFRLYAEQYKNSRNFASGSARLLDAKECEKRNLTFIAWDVISGLNDSETLSDKLNKLTDYGFCVIPKINNYDSIEEGIKKIQIESTYMGLSIDGIVIKYDNISEYEDCERTDHHFKGGLAYKFYDETYPTKLKHITWTMGRTGVLTPVAVFEPIDIDGTTVERASLHNVSVMREILGDCAYYGEPLEVCKMNQIIPQIVSAGPKYDYGEVIAHGGTSANDVIETCPICHSEVVIKKDGIAEVCYCANPLCFGKLLNKLDHFCGKKGLDIKGLSLATLEKLNTWNWVNNFKDIYRLSEHRSEWIKKPGFGVKSVDNILNAIEESRHNELWRVIAAAGIPNVGATASKQLANYFKTYASFRTAIEEDFDFTELPDFGDIMADNLLDFDYTDIDDVVFYAITCKPVEDIKVESDLKGKVFCITGKLTTFKNREELKNIIISLGGKVTDSVTSKTTALINNDITSSSAKNKRAKDLNIPIITEQEFKTSYLPG